MLNDDFSSDDDIHHDAMAYWIDLEILRWKKVGIQVTIREAFKFYFWTRKLRE